MRQFRRRLLWVAVVLVLVFCLKNFRRLFPPSIKWIDLRNQKDSLSILSPVEEPHLYLEQPMFLLVIVSSSPNKRVNAGRRDVIRKTWGNVEETRVPNDVIWKVVFVMGKPQNAEMNQVIMAEHRSRRDLLIGDYKDEYRNIVIKLLMAFQWASKIKCSYVLKTDDDVYIEIPKLIEWLIKRSDEHSLYGGILYQGEVVRDKTHRHYVKKDDLSLEHYPMFCKGSMFVLSWNLIPKMVGFSRHIKRIGPDDAYIGLLAFQLDIKPVEIQGFQQFSHMHNLINVVTTCQIQELIGIGDSLTPEQINYIHKVKKSLPKNGKLPSVCISLFMELVLLLSLSCTFLMIFLTFCCRRRCRLRIKR